MRRSKGFTLVEMAVGLFILAAVGTLAYKIMVRTQSSYIVHRDIVDATQNARIAMEMVTSDIRQISYGKDPTQASIVYAGIDSIVFVADMYDSIPGGEQVAFYLTPVLDSVTQNPSDRLIYRSVIDTSGFILEEGPVAYGVADSGLTFLYFDRDGAQMSFPIVQPEHISEIEVAVTAQTAHSEPDIGYRDFTVTSIVYPRNLPFSPPMARPSAPSCQNLTSPNCGSLTAQWSTPVTNTDGSELKFNDISHFSIYYGTRLDSMNLDTRLARNVNDWTVGDLNAGETYYIQVSVTSQAGVESFACTQSGAVGTTAPPLAPAGLSGTGGPSGISLSWSPVTDDSTGTAITAQVTYTIYRGTAAGFVADAATELVSDLADTTYFNPLTDSCAVYFYKVAARACGMDGGTSNEIEVTTTPIPSCPSSVFAIEGAASGEITVSWTPPTTRVDGSPLSVAEIQGYTVYYSLTGGVYTDSAIVAGGASSSLDLTGLLYCETYYANVAAIDQCSNRGTLCGGLESAARTKAPCNAMIPQAPTNLQATGADERMEISWRPNIFDCDLDGYLIYYGTSPGDLWGFGAYQGSSPVYVDAGYVQVDSSLAEFTLTGLTPCVEYYITVTSVDNCVPANESSFPMEVSDMVECAPCDIAKGCVYEEAEGSLQERARFTIANEGGTYLSIEEMEIEWGSGSNLMEILVGGTTIWSSDGTYGDGPLGALASPAAVDIWDFDMYYDEDFGRPVEMTLVFDASTNGDLIDVKYRTSDGSCSVSISPCGTMFSDDFTQANGAAAGWTPRTGTWSISGNELFTTSSSGRITSNAFGFGNDDFTLEADVRIEGSDSNRRGGIYVRYIDTGNYYLLRYYPAWSKLEFLRKVGSGALVNLAESYSYDVTGTGWHNFKVSAYGSTFRCWVNGQIIEWDGMGTVVSDGTIGSGNISMYTWAAGDSWFDNVIVSPTCGCGGVVP